MKIKIQVEVVHFYQMIYQNRKNSNTELNFDDFKDEENSEEEEKENSVTYEGFLIKVIEKK